jgi:hypothetical protein
MASKREAQQSDVSNHQYQHGKQCWPRVHVRFMTFHGSRCREASTN